MAWTAPRVDFCYACLPGGPFRPPPCCRCGEADDYYSAGLCARCHRHAPRPVESCTDCYAWGVSAAGQRLCAGCRSWRRTHATVTICVRCGRRLHVDSQMVCRLCRKQPPCVPGVEPGDVPGAATAWQQLFLAVKLHSWRGGQPEVPPAGSWRGSAGAAGRRRVRVEQLPLWGVVARRPASRPRLCPTCRRTPVKDPRSRYCYACTPGGPVTAPPCRRCGARKDYYSAGLCVRCHKYAPQIADSCPDCYAWGTWRVNSWFCQGCRAWRRNHPHVGSCRACERDVHLAEGICRLCVTHAALIRSTDGIGDPVAANRHGQQLFLADMFHRAGHGRRDRDQPAPPPTPGEVRADGWYQLVLLEMPRDLAAGRGAGFPAPKDPQMAGLFDRHVRDHAARHGWSVNTAIRTRQAIRILLGLQDVPGAPLKATEVAALVGIGAPMRAVREVLVEAGMFVDDSTPSIEAWFTRTVAGLPEPMTAELQAWFDTLLHGSTTPPRTRRRHPNTIRVKLRWALPALQAWAGDGHVSLREISPAQVRACLPPSGTPRATMGAGLRSIFGTLRARKVIFTDPIAHIATGSPEKREPLPTDLAKLREALVSTDDPVRAAIAALLAFCALEPRQLPRLTLADIRDGQLHLPGRVIQLAEPVRDRLAAYLDYRTRRWPSSANPYLFIHHQNAGTTTPAQTDWITHRLGLSAQAIREDRILHEAHATRGDVRRLCDLFGLSVAGAQRYTATVDHPAIAHLDKPPTL
ncbi:hypothetical protein [Frankia sp. CiP3]|uniref:hypothetical protein n=1 Tax=Frankia sp. CiP3 TaxID=2880971 RepID=UPI001EF521D6|nr:hypothetical protein [Frankia sp. CiP3]